MRPVAAIFLAVLVLQSAALREIHLLLDHHSDDAAICEASGQEKHLHSEEYAHSDCLICFVHISVAKLTTPQFYTVVKYNEASISSFATQTFHKQTVSGGVGSRAPPTTPESIGTML